MNKIKSAALIGFAIFLAGMFATAAAQKRTSTPSFSKPFPIVAGLSGTYTINLDAVEVSTGTVDIISGASYGWTWSGKTYTDLSGYMFFSLNFAAPDNSTAVEAGGDRLPPQPRLISGGSWSKVIFIDGVYAGTISGRVTSGQLVWSPDTRTSNVSLQLTSERGTEAFVGLQGTGTFVGVVGQVGEVTTITGVVTLEY